nr:integrase, catalytic region, zinc finger, CCHC-type, peptidase aspartic, catalytic [Tanacetum cinerariifolium]
MSQDNTKKNWIRRTQRKTKKNKIEDHLRTVKSSLNTKSVVDSKATSSVINSVSNVNSDLKCASCNGCLFSDNHDACVVAYIKSVNASIKSKSVKTPVVQIVLWYLDSGCSKHMTGDRSQLINFVHKFLGTVKFGNDHVAKIMGYEDYQIGNVTISRVYYVEGLGHNLFYVGQFCDSDLEVAFRQHTCFIRNLEGVDLLTGSRGNNLYTLSLRDMMASSPICLLSKASKTKSWLWHRRLSHLNFGAINHLARQGLVRGLPKLKFEKDHLCSACAMGKIARSPQQNGVVERCNCTLIEAAHTMLIYTQAPLFLWPEVVATTDFTQNRSIIRLRHGKTPYQLLHSKLPDLSFFHVFGALYYPKNDSENLGKLQPKANIGIFIGYAPTKKAFRIYNRRTRRIVETIHVDFDELTAMASEPSSSGPALNEMTPGTISSGLVQKSSPSTSYVPHSRNDWDLLFQPMFDELLNPPPSAVNQDPEVIAPIAEVIPPVHADSTGSPSSTTVDQYAPCTSKTHTTTEIQSSVIPQVVGDDNLDMEVAHMGNDLLFGVSIPEVTSVQSSSTASPQSIVQTNHPIPHHNSKWTKDHPLNNIIDQLSRPFSTRLQLHEQALFFYYDAFLTSMEPKTYKENKARLVARGYHQEEGFDFEESFAPAPYGLKQAPRAWYDMLSSFLLSQDFSKGSVDPTLFIRRNGTELLLISQSPRGIFINQSKYALESLKKYGFESCDPVDTPMVEKSKLDEDKKGNAVDPSHYRGMIGTLLYLTASRPDLQFAICMCTRYQARPTEKHDSSVALTAFADADHAGCQDTRRSTSGKYRLADLFTKALGRDRIEFLINKLGMRSFTPETLKQLMNEEDK